MTSDRLGAVVITGGAGGMGLEVARALHATGTLLLVDVRDEALAVGQAQLAREGIAADALRADVTVPSEIRAMAARVAELGGLRSLVHTAGLSPKMASGRRVLEVDLVGTIRVLEALLPHAGEGTAAVCVGSIAGYADLAPDVRPLLDDPLRPGFVDAVEAALDTPLDGAMGYVLAKRGVMRACERLSGEWGARGARLVSIAPGLMNTEMGRLEMEDDELMALMIESTPLRRPGCTPLPGTARDVAALAAFLCSDDASFLSGCDIRLDGGLVGSGRVLPGLA
jgi:NAD(P)-dependent dehydrogenase (short-subunit alcohol dehydrogenase family)